MRKRSKVLISAFTIGTMMVAGLIGLKGLGGPVKAEGEVATSKMIYIDPRSNIANDETFHWSDAEAEFALWLFGAAEADKTTYPDKWELMLACDDLPGCYCYEVDLHYTEIIFGRINPETAKGDISWDTSVCWNQSVNLPLADAKDLWQPNEKVISGEDNGKYKGAWFDVLSESMTQVDYFAEVPESMDSNLVNRNAYFFGNGYYVLGTKAFPGLEMTRVGESHVYKVTASISYDMVIFSGTIDGGTVYQTPDLNIPHFAKDIDPDHETGVKYSITGPYESGPNAGKLHGEWLSYSTAPFDTHTYRIWLDRQNNFEDGYQYSVHYWKEGSCDYEVLATGYEDFGVMSAGVPGHRILTYFDVSSGIVGCNLQFKVYDSITGACIVASDNHEVDHEGFPGLYADGDNAQLYYFNKVPGTGGVGDTYYFSRGRVGDTADCINGAKMSVVYDAYFTCSADKNNGYGAYDVFVKTWLHDMVGEEDIWWINCELASLGLTDYANGANDPEDKSDPYSSDKIVRTGETLQTKHEAMLALYTAAHSEAGNGVWNSITKENLPPVIISVGIVLIVAMTGLIIVIRKRRHALR